MLMVVAVLSVTTVVSHYTGLILDEERKRLEKRRQ